MTRNDAGVGVGRISARPMASILRILLTPIALLVATIALSAQTPRLVQQTQNAAKGASSLTMTLPQRTAAGSLVVVCLSMPPGPSATVSGGGVQQWTMCHSQTSGSSKAQIWAGHVTTTTSRTITIAVPSPQLRLEASCSEWKGPLGPLQFSAAGSSGTVAAPTPLASTPPLTVGRGDLVIAMLATQSPTEKLPQATPDWKAIASANAPLSAWSASGYRVVESAGSASFSFSFQSVHDHATAIAAFRAAPAPTGPPTRRQHASNQLWNASTLQVQLPSTPLPGSLLVVCHESNSSVDSRLQGCGVDRWTLCVTSAPAIVNSEIWAGIVGQNPSATLTITLGTSPNGAIASVSEWTGMPSPLAYQAELGSGPLGGTTARTPAVYADRHELIVAMAGIHQGGNTIGAPSQGFTELMQGYLPSTAQSAAYRIATQPGPVFTTWPLAHSTRWAAPIVVFGGM
jgi:hypothetical protein